MTNKASQKSNDMEARARDNEGPGETQQELAERQRAAAAKAGTPETVKALAEVRQLAALSLPAGRVVLAEGAFNRWSVDVEHGVGKEDLERTSFWQHHTKILKVGDELRARCVDGSWMAYLVVIGLGPRDVKMHVREFLVLDPYDPKEFSIPSEFQIHFAGSRDKWRVMRGNEVVKPGFESQSDASRWLANYLTALRR
jgi:hypothetical protein